MLQDAFLKQCLGELARIVKEVVYRISEEAGNRAPDRFHIRLTETRKIATDSPEVAGERGHIPTEVRPARGAWSRAGYQQQRWTFAQVVLVNAQAACINEAAGFLPVVALRGHRVCSP